MSTTIFAHCDESIRKLAVVKFPWNKTADTPYLTGIPPHIMIMSDMKKFETKLDAINSELMQGVKEELEKRDIGGGMHHAIVIQEEIQRLREELSGMRMQLGTEESSPYEWESGSVTGRSRRRIVASLHAYNGQFNILPKS